MDKVQYSHIQFYGSMGSPTSGDDMTVHSQLFPYQKKIVVDRERLYEVENPPIQPLFATTKIFGNARCSYLLCGYLIFYVLYLMTGALVFSALETPVENQIKLDVMRAKQEFFTKYPNVADDDMESLLGEVIRASNRGVSAARNVSGGPNWSFEQSLFLSSTLVTTIGYGHVTPLSKPGKVFCISYAVLGIPLTVVLLSALVERLLHPATALLRALNKSLDHMFRHFTIRLVHLIIIVLILLVFFMIIPVLIFSAVEPDWDFLDSFYYCFMSLTTIGLGDYIPGDSAEQSYRLLYKVAASAYLFIGLTYMMLMLTLFYDILQQNVDTGFSSVELDDTFESHEDLKMDNIVLQIDDLAVYDETTPVLRFL